MRRNSKKQSTSCVIISEDGSQERYDGCVMAVHAPDALKILGENATYDETRILGAFQYVYSDIFLHRDTHLMPQNPAAWSAWNFLGNANKKVCLTYWLNVLQASMVAAHGMLRKSCTILSNPKHMVPSWIETGACLLVTRFLGDSIATGCLILLEEEGTIFTFEGTRKKFSESLYESSQSPVLLEGCYTS